MAEDPKFGSFTKFDKSKLRQPIPFTATDSQTCVSGPFGIDLLKAISLKQIIDIFKYIETTKINFSNMY